MNYLVTGGAGFIRSNLVRELTHTGQAVYVLDALTYAGNLNNLHSLLNISTGQVIFQKGDIRDPEACKEYMGKIDIVFHLAAHSHVDRSVEGVLPAVEFMSNNAVGTATMLEAALIARAKYNKPDLFIYAGSDEEYGETRIGKFSEDSPLNPRSPYSASKAGGSLLTLSFAHSYGLPVIVTRSTNNFGPFQHVEKFIPRSITNLLTDQKIKLYGNGENMRDWVYVDDNCLALMAVADRGVSGEIYNIGAGNEYSNLEIATLICQIMGKDPAEMIQFVSDRPGHDFRYAVSDEKIQALGWKPECDFKTALEETIAWYSDNQSWWEETKLTTERFYEEIGR